MRCLCLWFFGLALASLPAPIRADSSALEQAALADGLDTQKPVYLSQVIGRIAAQLGEEPAVVRQGLVIRLDSLAQAVERHWRQKSDAWKEVLALRRDEMSTKQVAKLLTNLVQGANLALGSEKDYWVAGMIRRAALDAKVKRQTAHAYLERLVDKTLESGDDTGAERQFGLLISGHTNRFEVNKDPLFIFFRTQDEAFVLEQVREIQRFIIPRLVRAAARQPAIKYAVRQRERTALVRPEYHLGIGVDNLHFTGSNANLRPCLEATLELVELSSQTSVWTHDFSYCTDEQGSKNAENLHPFYDEVAEQLSQELDEALESER
jgi:hypothetical protein